MPVAQQNDLDQFIKGLSAPGMNDRIADNILHPGSGGLIDQAQQLGSKSPFAKDLSESNALPWQKYFEESPELGNVSNTINRAQDAKGYVDQATSGLHNKPLGGFVSSLGMGDPMLNAIGKKYERDVSGKVANLKTKAEAEQPVYESQQLSNAGKVLGSAEQLKIQNFKEQYQFQQQRLQLFQQWKAQKDASENSFLSSVIGIGTMGIGAALK